MSPRYRNTPAARPSRSVNAGCLRVFFGAFFLIGIFPFYVLTLRPMLQAASALRWEETPCVVDSSQVEVIPSSGRGGPTYHIEVVYHYRYAGQSYTSRRYRFGPDSGGRYQGAQRIADQYPPGRETVCYVDPSHPSQAVIDRGLSVAMLFGCIPLVFTVVGGLGFWHAPRMAGSQRTSQQNAIPTFTPASGEPMELKPQITPLGKFLLMLGFAAVWNGFISIFVYLAFFSPSHGGVPIFVKIFIGFFGLIGLLIFLGAIGSLLALFNPRIVLRARTDSVPLGGEFQFDWAIRGRADRLNKLSVLLEGREEATYQSGKNAQTATQVFAEIPVFETMVHETGGQGQARVTVPAGLMHTFHGRNNRIAWRLRIRAEIPGWTGFEQEHRINVLPRAAA